MKAFFLFTRRPIKKSVCGVKFYFDFVRYPVAKKMYMGAYEIGVCEALKHYLTIGDTYVDVGANIGYTTALGAGLVGKTGHVYSFEPLPEYFTCLKSMAEDNLQYDIHPLQVALGDAKGFLTMNVSNRENMGSSTALKGFLPQQFQAGTITVPVIRLDSYIAENNIKDITLIKIDVEGSEFPVLKGLENFLLKGGKLPYIICEVSLLGARLLGYELEEFFQYLGKFGYNSFEIINPRRKVNPTDIRRREFVDVLFIPYNHGTGR